MRNEPFVTAEAQSAQRIILLRPSGMGFDPQGGVLSFAVVSRQSKETPALRVLCDSAVNTCHNLEHTEVSWSEP